VAVTDERGFTIVEVLIATLIMMVIVGATFMLLNPAQGCLRSSPK
jgi:type II secretory pathway component PulJ